MKKENSSKLRQIFSALALSAVLGLSVAAQQSEPVCSKYYAVGSRACVASAPTNGQLGSGNVTGDSTTYNTASNGQLGTGSYIGDGGGGLGSGSAVPGGGTPGSGSFWDWVTSIF